MAKSQQQTAVQTAFPPAEARKHLQTVYDVDFGTLDILIQQAVAYTEAVAAIDTAAGRIIESTKQKYRVSTPVGRTITHVAPPPPELANLQTEKDNLIRRTLSSIETAIGPAQLEYITYRLMGQISIRSARAK
ncbi:MAG TPA: hypothetical protein VE621_06335 [Bryobacteraceae bacterium]|nr:hypothetical protein [Bryobacteraceae bacterium]